MILLLILHILYGLLVFILMNRYFLFGFLIFYLYFIDLIMKY